MEEGVLVVVEDLAGIGRVMEGGTAVVVLCVIIVMELDIWRGSVLVEEGAAEEAEAEAVVVVITVAILSILRGIVHVSKVVVAEEETASSVAVSGIWQGNALTEAEEAVAAAAVDVAIVVGSQGIWLESVLKEPPLAAEEAVSGGSEAAVLVAPLALIVGSQDTSRGSALRSLLD